MDIRPLTPTEQKYTYAQSMQKNGATYEPKPAEQTPQKTPKHKDLER